MNVASINGFGSRAFATYKSVSQRIKYWRRYLLLAIAALVVALNYIPDVLSTTTYTNVRIIDASQNSSNYVIKFEVVDPDNTGIPVVLEARNMRQMSDFHFVPSSLQSEAAGLVEYNKAVDAGTKPGPVKLVTVRTSGFGWGDAHRSMNITQIEPTFWSPLYNIAGSLIVFAYYAILVVGILSLVIEGIRPGNTIGKRKFAFGAAAVIAFIYVLDFFI